LYMLRLMGVPSRYISGYICPGSSEWRGEGATHAWAEVWLPDTGWVGIDPTNKCLAGERHVRVATGRQFSDCTPVKGTYRGGSKHTLEVTVKFGSKSFAEMEAMDPVDIFIKGEEGVPKNSYLAYLQMQQQQQQ
jgi:transglutaminase-like putative cysteine protease